MFKGESRSSSLLVISGAVTASGRKQRCDAVCRSSGLARLRVPLGVLALLLTGCFIANRSEHERDVL